MKSHVYIKSCSAGRASLKQKQNNLRLIEQTREVKLHGPRERERDRERQKNSVSFVSLKFHIFSIREVYLIFFT